MGKAGKEKKDEKLWAEIAKGYIEDKAKRIHSVERNYLDELNHMKAKLETRQTKPTKPCRKPEAGAAIIHAVRRRYGSGRPDE